MNKELNSFNMHRSGLRGFVPFVALMLWFLLAILYAGPAKANDETITAADLLPEIEAALMAEGLNDPANISLTAPGASIAADATITNLSYNPLSGRFVARLSSGSGTIAGVARMIARYPVLTRSIARGEEITEGDIRFVETSSRSNRGLITDPSDLIGKAARRSLASGAPVRLSDVEAPVLVEKGAIVTLVYEIAGLRMTHQGIARNKGGDGDIVVVENIESERTLKGIVEGRNAIKIIPRRRAIEG